MNNLNLLLLKFFTLYKQTLNILSNQGFYLNQKTFTNTLKDSDIFKNLKGDVRDEELTISIYKYYINIEIGRKKGAKQPPLSVILNWIKQKNIIPKNGISINSLAFLIARAIKRDGIKPRPIFSKAYEIASDKWNKELNDLINETIDDLITVKLKNKS